MPQQYKIEAVEKLKEILDRNPNFVITDYRGLNVSQITELRKQLLEQGVVYHVVKNTLFRIALKDAKVDGLDEYFFGPTAIAFAGEDIIPTTKILTEFAKKNPVAIKGGFTDGQVLSVKDVDSYSKLPSKEEVIGKLLMCIQSPIYGIVGTISGIMRQMAYVLSQISEKLPDGGSTAVSSQTPVEEIVEENAESIGEDSH